MFEIARSCAPTAAAALLALAASVAHGDTLSIDVAGALSQDVMDAAANTFIDLTLASGAHVTAVGWNVSLTAHAGSWLTEMTVSLLESTGALGVNLAPAYGENFAGTASFTSNGLVDLVGSGNNFVLGADGLLRLQFFEAFNDLPGADGVWNSGSITVEYSAVPVPEPSAWLLLLAGMGSLMWLSHRRNASTRD